MTRVGEDVEELEPSYAAGGNVKRRRAVCASQWGCSSRKLNIELPHDPAIPL